MKIRNFFVGALAALAFIVGCQEKEQNLGTPEISISVTEMTFEVAGGDQDLTVTSSRDWKVENDADWVVVSPNSGSASANPQTVTVSVLENKGYDRTVDLVFTIGLKKKYLTVNQAGPAGSTDDLIIYSNDYDKKPAEKDGSYWPYADVDHASVWNNAKGTGIADVTYSSYNVTVRNNSNSNGSYSDYAGSGVNNLFFGKSNPYFATYNISLGGATGLTLTFGTEKYSESLGSVFTNSEYHIYLSNDGTKWVELTDYTFAGGETAGRWNVATANFTVPAETQNLSICMQVDAESAYRLDDFKLVASEGGVEIDFTNAVEKNFAAGSAPGVDDGGDNDEEEPDTPETPIAPGEYDPQGITWTLGESAYDNTSGTNAQTANVNGVGVANLLKLGTGSKIGNATLHVPAGTEKIGFYCVAWNGKTAQVKFSINGEELGTIQPKANTGAANNPPYTITVTDSDYFVIDMPSTDAVDVKVETVDPANGRALFIKLEANPSSEGGEVTPPEGGEVTPPEGGETPEPGTVGTIADVLALGNGATIPANTVIEGVVISNMELNNLTSKKGMYVQDETAALQFYLAANHEFAFGDKVQIDLSGATVGAYNGAVQISGLALDKITKISSDNTVTPKTVTMADFLANKYEGQYVAIEGVQVVSADLSKTFVMGGAHTSINMEDASGNKFVVFSSKYASYGAQTVPQGSGTIKGISSINNGAMQIIFCQESDFAGLTGTRFDGTEVTPPEGGDDNQGGTEEPDQPVTPPTTGNEVWKYEFKSGDFGSTYSAPVTKTFNDVEWTCTMIGSTYFGYDNNNGRGLQIGKSKEPATEITLSTSGITGNIKKVVVNTSGASNTDAKLNVKVGEVALGSQVSMTTTATDVTFEATTATAGVLELKWTLTTAAVYVKSITVYTE